MDTNFKLVLLCIVGYIIYQLNKGSDIIEGLNGTGTAESERMTVEYDWNDGSDTGSVATITIKDITLKPALIDVLLGGDKHRLDNYEIMYNYKLLKNKKEDLDPDAGWKPSGAPNVGFYSHVSVEPQDDGTYMPEGPGLDPGQPQDGRWVNAALSADSWIIPHTQGWNTLTLSEEEMGPASRSSALNHPKRDWYIPGGVIGSDDNHATIRTKIGGIWPPEGGDIQVPMPGGDGDSYDINDIPEASSRFSNSDFPPLSGSEDDGYIIAIYFRFRHYPPSQANAAQWNYATGQQSIFVDNEINTQITADINIAKNPPDVLTGTAGAADNRCGENQYVSDGACFDCRPGTTNETRNDKSGDDTECVPTICGENEHLVDHECQECPEGTINAAGADASQHQNSTCDRIRCHEDHYVSGYACVRCPAGRTNAAGDYVPDSAEALAHLVALREADVDYTDCDSPIDTANECAPGTYRPAGTTTDCGVCTSQAGCQTDVTPHQCSSISDLEGKLKCAEVASGFYVNAEGTVSPCPEGKYSPAGASSLSDCVASASPIHCCQADAEHCFDHNNDGQIDLDDFLLCMLSSECQSQHLNCPLQRDFHDDTPNHTCSTALFAINGGSSALYDILNDIPSPRPVQFDALDQFLSSPPPGFSLSSATCEKYLQAWQTGNCSSPAADSIFRKIHDHCEGIGCSSSPPAIDNGTWTPNNGGYILTCSSPDFIPSQPDASVLCNSGIWMPSDLSCQASSSPSSSSPISHGRGSAVDCAGSWSACSSACTRTWTETAAQVGSGNPCPPSPSCPPGKDACPEEESLFTPFRIGIAIAIVCIGAAIIFWPKRKKLGPKVKAEATRRAAQIRAAATRPAAQIRQHQGEMAAQSGGPA